MKLVTFNLTLLRHPPLSAKLSLFLLAHHTQTGHRPHWIMFEAVTSRECRHKERQWELNPLRNPVNQNEAHEHCRKGSSSATWKSNLINESDV